jgi:hypothetical protein
MDTVKTIFVLCHSEKEQKRRQRLEAMFQTCGIPLEKLVWISPTWGTTLTSKEYFSVYDPFKNHGVSFKSRTLSKGEVSLALNFYAALRSAAEIGGNTIFLESDVYLRPDFSERLGQIFSDVSGRPWDYISLSTGVGTRPEGVHPSLFRKTRCFDPPHNCVFRCTDSMILSEEFIKELANVFLPLHDALDWHLNILFQGLHGKALWADPPLVEQGTNFRRDVTSLPA